MGRRLAHLALGFCCSSACDREAAPEPRAAPARADVPAVDTVAAAPAPVAPPPAPVIPPVAPAAAIDDFAALVARLIAGAPETADPHAAGFARYQAGAFAEAQRLFAQAARRDKTAWKHPYNLACAGARGGDEAVARVALIEAVRRGGDPVVAKARRDPDLSTVRASAWFEPVLRGETSPPAAPTSPAGADATTAPVAGTAGLPVADEATGAAAPVAGGAAAGETPPVPPTVADPPPPPPPPAPPKVELPRGSVTPIAAAQLGALVAMLTPTHHTAPVVRASLAHSDPGGATVGWVVYEYSRYDACIGEHGDAKTAGKKCRHRLVGVPGSGAPSQMECTEQWLVRLSPVDPPTPGKPEKLKLACALQAVRRLDALDLDGDGADEILLDVVGQHSSEGFRESEQQSIGRVLRILRLDGTVQAKFDHTWSMSELGPSEETVRRLELRDDDGDGHADLIVFERPVTGTPGLRLDDELWPAGPADDERGEITTSVWRYSVKKDRWIKPGG